MVEYVTWHGLGSIPAMEKGKKKIPSMLFYHPLRDSIGFPSSFNGQVKSQKVSDSPPCRAERAWLSSFQFGDRMTQAPHRGIKPVIGVITSHSLITETSLYPPVP